jgi:hypothetical protein
MGEGRDPRLARAGDRTAGERAFVLAIEDDGPGIPEDKAREALKRGKPPRRDQAGNGPRDSPSSPIWSPNMAAALAWKRSQLGGLRAVVELKPR